MLLIQSLTAAMLKGPVTPWKAQISEPKYLPFVFSSNLTWAAGGPTRSPETLLSVLTYNEVGFPGPVFFTHRQGTKTSTCVIFCV